jgi:hypothetical protein
MFSIQYLYIFIFFVQDCSTYPLFYLRFHLGFFPFPLVVLSCLSTVLRRQLVQHNLNKIHKFLRDSYEELGTLFLI